MKNLLFFLTLFMLSFALFSCKNNTTSKEVLPTNPYQSSLDTLDAKLNKILGETIITGFSVSILKGEEMIFSKGYGYADVQNKHLFTPQTKHVLASISKTYIGLSIVKLVEQGKLNLDDPINKYLPFKITSPHFPNTPITVRHLVNHTSSLNDEFDDGDKRSSQVVEQSIYSKEEIPKKLADDLFYFDGEIMSLEDYLKNIFTPKGIWYNKTNFSDFKPGTKYEYSNDGACLAALIVEKIAGKPFFQFTKENIFDPLDMKNTSWFYKDLDASVSKLYVPDNYDKPTTVFEFARYKDSGYPAGDLISNADDQSKYLIEMIKGFKGEGKILNAKSYQLLLNPMLERDEFSDDDTSAFNDEYNVGTFWAISAPGLRLHKGGGMGIFSLLYFNPETEVGVFTFCNLAYPDFGTIVNVVREIEKEIK